MTVVEAGRRAGRRWDVVRLLLAAVWAVLLLSAVLLREDDRSLTELYDQVRAGEVERVVVVGGLPTITVGGPGLSRTAQVDVRWGVLGDRHVTELLQVAGQGFGGRSDGREILFGDVVGELRALDPDLQVEQQQYRSGATGSLLGARLPGPAVALLLVSLLGTLYLVVNGPHPWRATRWAWSWLVLVPFGGLAFCLLSGRTPGLPPPRSDRRLTGGWAFLVGAILGGGGSFAS